MQNSSLLPVNVYIYAVVFNQVPKQSSKLNHSVPFCDSIYSTCNRKKKIESIYATAKLT